MASLKTVQWACSIAALVGVWIIVSPFVWAGLPGAFLGSNVVMGALIVILAGYTAYLASNDQPVKRYAAYIAGLAGLWVILSPFALGITNANVLFNNFVSGGVVAVLTGYSGYVGPALRDRIVGQQAV